MGGVSYINARIIGNDVTVGYIYKCDLIADVYVTLLHEVKGNFGLQIVRTEHFLRIILFGATAPSGPGPLHA